MTPFSNDESSSATICNSYKLQKATRHPTHNTRKNSNSRFHLPRHLLEHTCSYLKKKGNPIFMLVPTLDVPAWVYLCLQIHILQMTHWMTSANIVQQKKSSICIKKEGTLHTKLHTQNLMYWNVHEIETFEENIHIYSCTYTFLYVWVTHETFSLNLFITLPISF